MLGGDLKRRLQLVALGLVGIYLAMIVGLYLFQEKMIFYPRPIDPRECSEMKAFGAVYENSTFGDEELRYYIKRSKAPRGIFLHFHGNAGSACGRDFILEEVSDPSWTIVLAEYPGFSIDDRHPTQRRILKNSLAIYDHLRENEEGGEAIVLFGESLGTGVATYVASTREVEGLFLQSPYPSVTAIAQSRYPFIPINLFIKHPFPAEQWAPKVKAGTLIYVGDEDRVIPMEFSEIQSKNFRNLLKYSVRKGARHRRLCQEECWQDIHRYLEEVLNKKGSSN
jgi:pimeloyl-ACP methyl ester carboxylesterase